MTVSTLKRRVGADVGGRTIWSIMIRILVFACSQHSMSPKIIRRNLFSTRLSMVPWMLAESTSMGRGFSKKMSALVRSEMSSICLKMSVRTPSVLGTMIRVESTSTVAARYLESAGCSIQHVSGAGYTYQGDGSLVQYLCAHLVDQIRVARKADICDQSVQRTSLHAGDGLGSG